MNTVHSMLESGIKQLAVKYGLEFQDVIGILNDWDEWIKEHSDEFKSVMWN